MKTCDAETPGQPRTARCVAFMFVMQHQAYQPLLPVGNKYLQQKWDKASYDLHRRKVNSAKPSINTTPPRTPGHLALKMKKQKLEEEWAMKIERENNMLREKISRIMKTTGAADNRNFYSSKSLGKEKRQLELLRITKDNEMILRRLTQCKSHYDRRSWHEDWLKHLNIMDSIARYPRGGANQQMRQENLCKESSDRDKEQKTMKNKIHARYKTSNRTGYEENKATKGMSKEEDANK